MELNSTHAVSISPRGRRLVTALEYGVIAAETMATKIQFIFGMVVKTARLMVGVPDYDNYVARFRVTHPHQPAMTYKEFFRDRQEARYAVGKEGFFWRC